MKLVIFILRELLIVEFLVWNSEISSHGKNHRRSSTCAIERIEWMRCGYGWGSDASFFLTLDSSGEVSINSYKTMGIEQCVATLERVVREYLPKSILFLKSSLLCSSSSLPTLFISSSSISSLSLSTYWESTMIDDARPNELSLAILKRISYVCFRFSSLHLVSGRDSSSSTVFFRLTNNHWRSKCLYQFDSVYLDDDFKEIRTIFHLLLPLRFVSSRAPPEESLLLDNHVPKYRNSSQ